MKFVNKLTKTILATSVFALTGCSGSSSSATLVEDAKEVYGCNVINVYNAGEYIGDGVLADFEKAYNAKVNYETFESNETMYTKLLGGSAYDVLVPSDYMIERLMQENMLQKLDKESLTNLDQLSDTVVKMQKVFDPETEYSVPYFWGSVGFVYNKNVISEEELTEKGWNILLDETYKGRVYMYDSQRDAFMVAFKALGYSMNTTDADEIEDAYNWLRAVDQAVEPAYVTDQVIDAMTGGEKDIALMYSGDAAAVMAENEDMAYFEPLQGTNIWIDAMVIPANSNCPGLANAFINYMTDYDAAYENSDYVGYTSPNATVFEELSADDGTYGGISAYIPRENYELDEVFHFNEILRVELSDRWNKVKIGE